MTCTCQRSSLESNRAALFAFRHIESRCARDAAIAGARFYQHMGALPIARKLVSKARFYNHDLLRLARIQRALQGAA